MLIKRDGDLAETPEEETGGRWVLRLWPSQFRLKVDGGDPVRIHVGSLIHERILRPLNELSTPRADRDLPHDGENPLPKLPGVVSRTRPDGSSVVLGGPAIAPQR